MSRREQSFQKGISTITATISHQLLQQYKRKYANTFDMKSHPYSTSHLVSLLGFLFCLIFIIFLWKDNRLFHSTTSTSGYTKMKTILNTTNTTNKSNNLRRQHTKERKLQEQERDTFDIDLFLELQYVDESIATNLETKNWMNVHVAHFCRAVNTQVC